MFGVCCAKRCSTLWQVTAIVKELQGIKVLAGGLRGSILRLLHHITAAHTPSNMNGAALASIASTAVMAYKQTTLRCQVLGPELIHLSTACRVHNIPSHATTPLETPEEAPMPTRHYPRHRTQPSRSNWRSHGMAQCIASVTNLAIQPYSIEFVQLNRVGGSIGSISVGLVIQWGGHQPSHLGWCNALPPSAWLVPTLFKDASRLLDVCMCPAHTHQQRDPPT